MIAVSILTTIIALLLIGAVLIQNPKGGGVDSTFGGGQANQMFGVAKSADMIEKITWGLAIALIILCVATTFLIGGSTVGPIIQTGG